MFKDILNHVDSISNLSIGLMLIFFIFFVVVSIMALRLDKSYTKKMEDLPLDKK